MHGDLLVEIRSDRIRRDKSSFKDPLSHRFYLRQGGDKTVRFDFEPDELYVNIGVTLDEGNSSVVGVSFSVSEGWLLRVRIQHTSGIANAYYL